MAWVGRDLKDPLEFQPSVSNPSQDVPSPIQPGLDHCQGWVSHSCSWQSVPGPCREDFFLKTNQSKSTLFQFKPSPLVLSLLAPAKCPSPALLKLLWALERTLMQLLSLLFSRMKNFSSFSLCSQKKCFNPLIILAASSGLIPTDLHLPCAVSPMKHLF